MKNGIQKVCLLENGNTVFVTNRGMVEVDKLACTAIFWGERKKGYERSVNDRFWYPEGFRSIVKDIRAYAHKI